MKIGIFGGSFNPPHNGHVNALTSVVKKLGLNKVHIVPAGLNPLKPQLEGPTAEQRLELTKLAFSTYGDTYFVDDQEIKRGGASFTIDTVKKLKAEYKNDELSLIVGFDAFEKIGQWKDYAKLLSEVNWIIVSRPGTETPHAIEDLPEVVQALVQDFDFNFVELTTGKSIQFLQLKDLDISSTEVRKKIRIGKNLEKYLPLAVENFIKEHGLYKTLGPKIGDYEKFTQFCAKFFLAKKSIAIRAFDLRKISYPTEFTVITSGTSTRHATSLAENLVQAVKDEFGVYPHSLEGASEGRWVVIDYGSLIVHVFYDFARQEYRLEDLWKNGVEIKIE